MEILIVLLLFALVVCGPVALVAILRANQRIGRLEYEIERLRKRLGSGPPPAPATTVAPAAAAPEPEASAEPAPPSAGPAPATRPAPRPVHRPAPRPAPRQIDLESILGGQWLTWAGILALFFGTAFFLGVDLGASALSGLPQVLIGLAVAALFNVVGRLLSVRRERILGLGLLGGGVALLYLAAYAAYGFHHLIPLWVAFPPLLVVAAIGAWLALDRDSVAIAALTLIGALLTPIVLSAGDDPTFALLPYLFAVNLGAVVVGFRRGWAGLPLGAFLTTVLLILAWWDAQYDTGVRLFALLNVSALWLLYAIAPWLRRGPTPFWSAARAAVLAGNGLLYALFCYHLLAPDLVALRGWTLAALAVLYVGAGHWIQTLRGGDEATRLTHFTGVALAAISIPVLLDAGWVVVGWAALSCVLLYAGLREDDRAHRLSGLSVLALVLLRSLFFDVPDRFQAPAGVRPVWNGDFLGGLLVIAALGWLLWQYRRHAERLTAPEKELCAALPVLIAATLAWKGSFELLAWFTRRDFLLGADQLDPAAQTLLLFWAIYGLAALLIGARLRHLALRVTGLLLIGAAAAGTGMWTLGRGLDLYVEYKLLLNLPFMQGAAVSAVLAAVFFGLRRDRDILRPAELRLATPALLLALLLFLLKISMEVVAYFQLPAANEVVDATLRLRSLLTLSLVWGLYSGGVIVAGFASRFRPVRLLGMMLLGLTVLKVFLLDIQSLDRGYRIAAFIALGVLLLGVSLLYQRQRKGEENP